MLFRWLKSRRRRKLLARRMPRAQQQYLETNVPFFADLDAKEKDRLEGIVRILMAEKRWVGRDVEIDDRMMLNIAAHAARLILNIEHDYYCRVHSIYITPSSIEIPRYAQGGQIVNAERIKALGIALDTDAVVLAADAVRHGTCNDQDGHNVVYHEFAHKLDTIDHDADGTPPLDSRQQYRDWHDVMTRHYAQHCADVKKRRRTVLRPYGATNPAEFFACVTETFFEKAEQLRDDHPDLYRLLREYFKQNPAGM